MSKLNLDALKMRAESIASEELMASISGGTENACHPKDYDHAAEERKRLLELLKKPCTGNA